MSGRSAVSSCAVLLCFFLSASLAFAADIQVDGPLPVSGAVQVLIPPGDQVVAARVVTEEGGLFEARVLGSAFWHGYHLAGIEVPEGRVPVRLELDLAPLDSPVDMAQRRRDVAGWREGVGRRVRAIVANPRAVDGYALPSLAAPLGKRPAAVGKTPSLASSPVRMLILTTSEMAAAFEPLAEHRSRQGLPALVVTLDDIAAHYRQGADLPETIRLYVQDAYERWGVDYLLLGGDTGALPARTVHSTFYPPGGETGIAADLYFGGLDGNWNADGDSRFGEPFVSAADVGDDADLMPEVAVGRTPVRTLQEAHDWVAKVLAYEQPADLTYQARLLSASEVLFPSSWSEGEVINLDGAQYEEVINATIMACQSECQWEIFRFYENWSAFPDVTYPGACSATPAAVPESKDLVVAALDSGNYGLVTIMGHGFLRNLSLGDDSLLASEVGDLSNGPNYFVLHAMCSKCGQFIDDSILEHFVRDPDGGSVAAIGSSDVTFPTTASNFMEELYDDLFCVGVSTRIGDVHDASRLPFVGSTFIDSANRWATLTSVLLGDPSMPIWTALPRVVDVTAPASIGLGPQNVSVTVMENGSPVSGATVALSKSGEVTTAGVTDASGAVLLSFDAETPGPVDVQVSGANVLPTGAVIAAVDGGAAFLGVAAFAIKDGGTATSSGNQDGRLDAGEIVDLIPIVQNSGALASGMAQIDLAVAAPHVTLVDGTSQVAAVAAGSTQLAADPLVLSIDPAASDAAEITLNLTLTETAKALSWADVEVLTLAAPELEVLRLDLVDTSGDGIVQAGEDVELIFMLKNFGSGGVASVSGVVTSADPQVQVVDAAGSWGALPQVLDQAANDADRFLVRELDVSQRREYVATLTDAAGRVWNHGFDLRRPAVVADLQQDLIHHPGVRLTWTGVADPDLRGYRVYRREVGSSDFVAASADVIESATVFADEDLPPLTAFEYVVRAVDHGGLESENSIVLRASSPPAEVSCFPLTMALETSSSVAVGHVDDDGVLDLAVGSSFVYVLDGNCNEKMDGDGDALTLGPINAIESNFTVAGTALGQLDGSAGLEIVASDWSTNRIYVLDASGAVLPGWPVALQGRNWTTPAVDDLDGDGDYEIVVSDVVGWTYAFHHDGTEVADGDANPATVGPIAPQRAESFGRTSPALYDVDGDGLKEILFGSKFQNGSSEEFYALKPDGSATHAPGWPKTFSSAHSWLSSPAVGDINDDGIDEIVCLSEGDELFVWRPDGTEVAPFPQPYTSRGVNFSSLSPSVALGDFTGDGKLEIVLVEVIQSTLARVRILDHQNNTLPGWPQDVESLSESSPVVGDLNGDGSLDVVFASGGGSDSVPDVVRAWNADGTLITGFPVGLAGFPRGTPTIVDFNGDGNVNLLLAAWDRLLHVWDMERPYDEALTPWGTFRGNVQRNGVFGTRVPTSVPPDVRGALAGLAASIHPNPFNPSTMITFELPGPAEHHVELGIYDAAGRYVVTLLQGSRSAGEHSLRWDGRDAQGSLVASGVYHARLSVEGHEDLVRKMTLVK